MDPLSLLLRPEITLLSLALTVRYAVAFAGFVLALRRVPASQRADVYAMFAKTCTHPLFLGGPGALSGRHRTGCADEQSRSTG